MLKTSNWTKYFREEQTLPTLSCSHASFLFLKSQFKSNLWFLNVSFSSFLQFRKHLQQKEQKKGQNFLRAPTSARMFSNLAVLLAIIASKIMLVCFPKIESFLFYHYVIWYTFSIVYTIQIRKRHDTSTSYSHHRHSDSFLAFLQRPGFENVQNKNLDLNNCSFSWVQVWNKHGSLFVSAITQSH